MAIPTDTSGAKGPQRDDLRRVQWWRAACPAGALPGGLKASRVRTESWTGPPRRKKAPNCIQDEVVRALIFRNPASKASRDAKQSYPRMSTGDGALEPSEWECDAFALPYSDGK